MGWYFGYGATKKSTVENICRGWEHSNGGSCKALSKSVRGNVLWVLHESTYIDGSSEKWIGCYLLGVAPGVGWGYKSMSESMGPAYYSCPLRYLEEAPQPESSPYAAAWREGVRSYHAERKQRRKPLKIGDEAVLVRVQRPWLGERVKILSRSFKKGQYICLSSIGSLRVPRRCLVKAQLILNEGNEG